MNPTLPRVSSLEDVVDQHVGPVVRLHHVQACGRPQLEAEGNIFHTNIQLPGGEERHAAAEDDMRLADVGRAAREVVREQLVLLSGELSVQMQVETFKLHQGGELDSGIRTVYLQSCLGGESHIASDYLAWKECARYSVNSNFYLSGGHVGY